MTSKINIFRKAVCFMVLVVLMLNNLTFTAFAAGRSKTVTYSTSYTFIINPSQLSDYMDSSSSHVPATYYYDDGTYKGTLSLTYSACSASTATGNPIGSQLEVRIFTEYSGTVYAADESKTVTYNGTYNFVVSPSQFPNYMNSPSSYVPSTHYYDDGTYAGTLYLTYAACSAPTATGNPVGSLLKVRIFTTYSGTVYLK